MKRGNRQALNIAVHKTPRYRCVAGQRHVIYDGRSITRVSSRPDEDVDRSRAFHYDESVGQNAGFQYREIEGILKYKNDAPKTG